MEPFGVGTSANKNSCVSKKSQDISDYYGATREYARDMVLPETLLRKVARIPVMFFSEILFSHFFPSKT